MHSTTHPDRADKRLLTDRRFAPFFWVQFLGALNDNVFKVGVSSLVTFHAARYGGFDPKTAAFLISAAFVLPFIPFSATSGQIADKFDKARLTRLVKTFEIGVMACAAVGFALHSGIVLFACIMAMGLHSTVFGPVKYAYLPQHLSERELVTGNGLFEMGTFVAILLGTILGGVVAAFDGGALAIACASVTIALAGRVLASRVPVSPAPAPDLKINWNPVTETWRNLRLAEENRTVLAGILGISWLWFVGASFLSSFFIYAKETLGADASVVTLLLACFSIGIGAGSLLCARLARHRVEIGLTPLGSLGMTLFGLELVAASRHFHHGAVPYGIAAFLVQPAAWRIMVDLLLVSAFGGVYSVPLYALIQSRSAPTHRARIIAANNILNALLMVVSALLASALAQAGYSVVDLFLVTALLNIPVALLVYWLAPEFVARCAAWVAARAIYRMRVEGAGCVPPEGGAVLAGAPVGALRMLAIAATAPRQARVAYTGLDGVSRAGGFLLRAGGAIDMRAPHAQVEWADTLARGELICAFADHAALPTTHGAPVFLITYASLRKKPFALLVLSALA